MPDYPLDDIRETRTELTRLTERLEAQLRELVIIARSKGHSWEDIGQALGIARQNAWERYAPQVEAHLRRLDQGPIDPHRDPS